MKMLNTLRAATLATLAGAAFSLPNLAQADDYYGYQDPNQKCRNKESDAQIVGGLLGAVVGGVVGSQIAGDGQRTEGSAIGAVLGAAAGASLGDESVDCDKRRAERRRAGYDTDYYNGYRYQRPTRTYYPNYGYNNGYRTAGYRTHDYGYRRDDYRRDNYRRSSSYYNVLDQLQDVRYRLSDLKRENRRLEAELRYGYNPRLKNRQDWVCDEIRRLRKKERRLEKRLRRL